MSSNETFQSVAILKFQLADLTEKVRIHEGIVERATARIAKREDQYEEVVEEMKQCLAKDEAALGEVKAKKRKKEAELDESRKEDVLDRG